MNHRTDDLIQLHGIFGCWTMPYKKSASIPAMQAIRCYRRADGRVDVYTVRQDRIYKSILALPLAARYVFAIMQRQGKSIEGIFERTLMFS